MPTKKNLSTRVRARQNAVIPTQNRFEYNEDDSTEPEPEQNVNEEKRHFSNLKGKRKRKAKRNGYFKQIKEKYINKINKI